MKTCVEPELEGFWNNFWFGVWLNLGMPVRGYPSLYQEKTSGRYQFWRVNEVNGLMAEGAD